eukprot:gene15295-2689_t
MSLTEFAAIVLAHHKKECGAGCTALTVATFAANVYTVALRRCKCARRADDEGAARTEGGQRSSERGEVGAIEHHHGGDAEDAEVFVVQPVSKQLEHEGENVAWTPLRTASPGRVK